MNPATRAILLYDLINERAKTFADANFDHPTPSDYLLINSAMTIGVSIAHEVEMQALRKEIAKLKAQ